MNYKKQIILVAFIVALFTAFGFQGSPDHKILFEKAKFTMETKGDLNGAINLFTEIIKKYPKEREYAAKSQLYIGLCYEKLGVKEAQKAYQKVVSSYPEQTEAVKLANEKLSSLLRAEASNQKPDKLPATGTELTTRRVLADASGIGEKLSADGKYIRGLDRETGDVVQFEVASGQRTRIKNMGDWSETEKTFEDQVFSRDGKQIAYNAEVFSDEKVWVYTLRIRNLDGSGFRTLYSEKGSYIVPLDWSPDAGSILALREHDKGNELILISTVDGTVRILKSIILDWFSFGAGFSPDGRFVAFSSVRDGSPSHGDIFLMTADGRNEMVVAGHPAEDRLLGWTPDGKSLLFLSDRSGTWDMWAVRIIGGKQAGEPELLKKDFSCDSEVLGFAPDGSCYYQTYTALGGLYNGEIDLETGKVLSPPAPITTRYTGPKIQPTWSPDGRNLLYISRWGGGPGQNILTIRSVATGEERFLSPRLRWVNHISWAPDGRSVIAIGMTETGNGIFRIDTETSGITKLADGGLAPRLCPDGKTLVFVKEGPIIMKRNLDTGEESEVVKIRGMNYDLSPDGREVVFQKDSTIKIVSLNGGEPREIFRGKAADYRWTTDGRYIIVRARGTLWRVPAQGGTPLKLDLAFPKMWFFTLHPDNRRFAFFVIEESKSELWVLENFLSEVNNDDNNQKSDKLVLSGDGSWGELSPDETKVAYPGLDNQRGEILVKDIKTSIVKTLVKPQSKGIDGVQSLVWSPDGTQIAYTHELKTQHEMTIVNVESGKSRTIWADSLTYCYPQDWSADSKNLVCVVWTVPDKNKTNTWTFGYGLYNVETRKLSQFVSAEGLDNGTASFSPDGRYVVYDLVEKGNRDLFIYSITTGEKIRLTDSPAKDGNAKWSRNGKYILFNSNRSGSNALWAIPIQKAEATGEPFLVQPSFENNSIIITNKGKLAYNVWIEMLDVYTLAINPSTSEIAGKPKLITSTNYGKHFNPSWSPDGKKITFLRLDGDNSILCIRTIVDGSEKYFTDMQWIDWFRWSPDGKHIALAGQTKEYKKGVFVYSFDTNSLSTILENLRPDLKGWSSNSKELIFLIKNKKDNKEWDLVGIDITTKERTVLETNINITSAPSMSLSPDSKFMAYIETDTVAKETRIVVSGLKNQEKRILVTVDQRKTWISNLRWSPDGRMIEYSFGNQQLNKRQGEAGIVATDGSWNKNIKTGKLVSPGASWSPDGNNLALTLWDLPIQELRVLENFLPK